MDFDINTSDRQISVVFRGELDETAALALSDRILNLCPANIPNVVEIDLTQCASVCHQGFGALVSFRLSPQISEKSAQIRVSDSGLMKKMKTLRLDKLFKLMGPAE